MRGHFPQAERHAKMKKAIKKLFGGLDLTWPKLIAAAVIAGLYTAAMAIIPLFSDTSFDAITVTLESWILFGIIIIMNSRSNLDAALKCFVFFLISQPLVYLIQVPFSALGWGLFGYYRYWFMLTLLCFPMGFIGYYMKKDKWWGFLILLPMILLTAYCYMTYLPRFFFACPRYILVSLFCAAAMLIYPGAVFNDRKIRTAGTAVSALILIAATAVCFARPYVYSTELMVNGETYSFDDTYSVYFNDEKYGDLEIRYLDSIEDYSVHAELRRAGKAVLTLESPAGEKTEYEVSIEMDRYDITPKK